MGCTSSSGASGADACFYETEEMKKMPDWIKVGCGDAPYYCEEKKATYGGKEGITPLECPDISGHSSFMTDVLKRDPSLYAKLAPLKTKLGVTFGQCIKTGMDNPGHPHIKTCGIVAGDEECWTLFKDIFDPVISDRHNGYPADGKQPTNLDIEKLSKTDIDPYNKYVLTSRVRTGRSIAGYKLPPVIGFGERRKLESEAVKGLMSMKGELKGDYFPLHGSRSYAPKPNGMTPAKEEELRTKGNLFQEPDSTLLLASGMGRHWPDGRGVFHNDDANLFVWVGEEDHLRIVSMQGQRDKCTEAGKDMRSVVARFMKACEEVEASLKAGGKTFMHNEHLGFVLTCPSNLGTGLRAGAMAMVPQVSGRSDWKDLCGKMKLQARGTGGVDSASTGGTWDISNADRIGTGEVDLVNHLIEGLAKIVNWEHRYADEAEAVEAEIQAVLSA
jgi:creatine kinase